MTENTRHQALDTIPETPALPMQAVYEIHTHTGSRYTIQIDSTGTFWLKADNVPNRLSQDVSHGLWVIDEPVPWPAKPGLPIQMAAPAELERDDPRRIPGGGKRTSPVRVVKHPTPEHPGPTGRTR